MVLLKYLGSYGNAASFQKIGIGIPKGTVNECVTQVCSASLNLQKQVIKWQNEEQKKHQCKD